MFCLRGKSLRKLRISKAREELKSRYENCVKALEVDKTRAYFILVDFNSFVMMEFNPLLTDNPYYTPAMHTEDVKMITTLENERLKLLELIYSKLKE